MRGTARRTGPRRSGNNLTPGYYSYNDHSDVEAVTTSTGGTKSTYGYTTAYGQPITSQWTGADKNNTQPSATTQPLNSYRHNAMRWDSNSGQSYLSRRWSQLFSDRSCASGSRLGSIIIHLGGFLSSG